MVPVLEIKDLSFSYGDHAVLHNIDLRVGTASFCGLLGANGSGKTTLMKCINRVLKPDYGEVYILGKPVSHMPRREIAHLTAMVPQQLQLVFGFTVKEMVVMGRSSYMSSSGTPKLSDYRAASQVLKELGISYLENRCFNELSGGERQMVLIARALCQEPRVLLLDEPTAHLDFKNQYLIMELVKDLTVEKHLATLVTLHDPNLAGRFCERLVMLKKGVVVMDGDCHEVFRESTLTEIYDLEVVIEKTEMALPVTGGKSNH